MEHNPQVIFITGAGNGLGLQTTKHLLSLGHSVVAADLNIQKLEELESSAKLVCIKLDVTSENGVKEAI